MAGELTELRCALRDADTMRVPAPAAKSKGDTEVKGDLVVFYLDDAGAAADLVSVCFDAKKAYFTRKTKGLLINAGDRVYWNEAGKVVTKTASDRAIGWGISRDDNAGVASAAGDTDVWIRFHQEVESSTY